LCSHAGPRRAGRRADQGARGSARPDAHRGGSQRRRIGREDARGRVRVPADQGSADLGGFVGHVANSEFGYCARVKGEPNPNKQDFEKVAGKAALVAGLKAAVAYCDAVYKMQSDASLSEMITMGQGQQPRGMVLVQNISHTNEHYGNLVTYMRIKGLVPPSTERATATRPGGR
jgi:uncharacterized damage-inducible protein DinB